MRAELADRTLHISRQARVDPFTEKPDADVVQRARSTETEPHFPCRRARRVRPVATHAKCAISREPPYIGIVDLVDVESLCIMGPSPQAEARATCAHAPVTRERNVQLLQVLEITR